MQSLRFFCVALLVWCQPYYEYVPTTSATYSAPTTPAITERDASGELPSSAEPGDESSGSGGVFFPFLFPFFPLPPIDPGYAPRAQPAYGPGGGR